MMILSLGFASISLKDNEKSLPSVSGRTFSLPTVASQCAATGNFNRWHKQEATQTAVLTVFSRGLVFCKRLTCSVQP